MAIHRVLAQGCTGILSEVFRHGRVLDRALDERFRTNPKWGKRDRAFVAETVFECVRWYRALASVADDDGLESVCAAQWRRMGLEIPGWWSWGGCSVEDMPAREAALAGQPRAVRESVPDWLDARGEVELGGRWAAAISALNRRAPVFLRVNALRNDREEARAWLAAEGVESEAVPGFPEALRVAAGRQVSRRLLAEGRVEIQDIGSQRIAPLLDVEPGMRVIDACAGAGGKTLHLAALMGGQGRVLAMDVSAAKLDELQRRVKGAGVRMVRVERWDGGSFARHRGWADRVLIDAPCSGLGTLRRQPDLKWRLSEASLEKTARLQRKLLDGYPGLLRAGGKFVYATCSVLPTENEGQIAGFMGRGEGWRVEAEEVVSPVDSEADGFYAARLGPVE